MFQISIMKWEIKSCPVQKKKIFEISHLLTWYHTISAEGAEDWWWWCWAKSFQTFRFVAVSSPPTTWSRTTDHFPPVIYVIWVQIQLHFVNVFFKKKLAKHFPSKWNALLPPFPVLYIYTEMVQQGQKGRRPSSRLRSFLQVDELALVHSFPQFLLR